MKKRNITLIIALIGLLSMSACGNQETSSNNVQATNESTIESTMESTQDETIETPIEDSIVESGTLDIETPSGEEIEEVQERELTKYGTKYDYTKAFGKVFETTAEATDFVNPFVKDETMARHYISYKDEDGFLMEFTFDGPTDLQGAWTLNGNLFTIASDDESYRMDMWHGGVIANEDELIRNFDVETIMSFSDGTPVGEETLQIIEDDNSYRAIFQVTRTYNGVPYMGYDCYIDVKHHDIVECYQFSYYVEESLFDADEVLAVVKSIAYYPFDALVLED